MTDVSSNLTRVATFIGMVPTDVVGQIILASSDVCILVGPDMVVEDVVVGFALDDIGCTSWRGSALRKLVGPEGQRKVDLLWADATVAKTGWRHLNFRTDQADIELPLLVQRIATGAGGSVLVCRDLRPAVRVQQQFNRAMTEMEQRREDVVDLLSSVPPSGNQTGAMSKGGGSVMGARSVQADAMVRQAFEDLGQRSLSQIVEQTARVLEEMCIREAYAQCGHDLAATARLLEVDPDDLAQRLAFFQVKA